jgi:AcrR family transcriptional regulator
VTEPDRHERILQAAMTTIARRGMAGLRMEDVGREAGMSAGHILYYYRSKQRLLLETLRWSEDRLTERRERELAALPAAPERVCRFIELYLPDGPAAEWLLWLQAEALSLEDAEADAVMGGVLARYVGDLAAVVREGGERGELPQVDAQAFAEEMLAVLDGLSLHVLRYGVAMSPSRAIDVAVGIAGRLLGVALRP